MGKIFERIMKRQRVKNSSSNSSRGRAYSVKARIINDLLSVYAIMMSSTDNEKRADNIISILKLFAKILFFVD